MKLVSSSPNVSSEETNDSVTKPLLKESSPTGSKSIRKLSASNIVGVPVPLSASERAKEDEEEKKRKEKEKMLQIVPLRKLLGWLFSIGRQYVSYYLCLFTTIILNNIGLLLVPRYIGKYVDTLNSSRPECLDCQILFYPVSEGTQALFYLSVAATMLAVGVGLRLICEEITGATVCMDITKHLFRTVLQQEIDFFNENKSGTLLSRITNDVFIIRHIMGFSVGQASVYIFLLLGAGTLSFYTSYKLSLILIFIIVPVFGIIGMKLHSHIRWIANEIQNALASGVSFAEETLSAAETVKYLSSEAQSKVEYERLCNVNFEFKKQKAKLFSGWALFISFISASGVCACIWYASTLVQSGELSSGDLWTFIVYMAQSIVAVIILSVLYTDLTALIGGAQHVFELSQRIPKLDLNHGTIIRKEDWKGVIKFEHINFSYPLVSNQLILSDINFELYPGKTLAIVGKSGSGKSTLAKLILGLYKPTRGKISIDGIDIHSLKSSYWRGKIGYVQQEPVLFSMSIFENIAFSSMLLPTENAADNNARQNEKMKKRVEKVAKMANADGYILKLEHGYQTQVGERGAMLSGGQKQKIAIARALMKNPKILVLDEATSALDAKSEKKVQKALNDCLFGDKGFTKEHCTIIIAHRLSTVKIADEIIVIDKGEIVERGTHTELYQLGKVYKNLVESKQELT